MSHIRKFVFTIFLLVNGFLSLISQSTIGINDGFFYFYTHTIAYNESGINYGYRCNKPKGLSFLVDYACTFFPQSNYYTKVSGLIGYSTDLQKTFSFRFLVGGGLMNTTEEYYPLHNNDNPKYLKELIAGFAYKVTPRLRFGVDFTMRTAYEKNNDLKYNGRNFYTEAHWYNFDMVAVKFGLTYILKSKKE
jgi:hypothetical protein